MSRTPKKDSRTPIPTRRQKEAREDELMPDEAEAVDKEPDDSYEDLPLDEDLDLDPDEDDSDRAY
jgi:hypothetical protein